MAAVSCFDFFFFFLLWGLWGLSSPTRDPTPGKSLTSMLLMRSDMCTSVSICTWSFPSGPSGTICFLNGFEHFNYDGTRCVFSMFSCSSVLSIWLFGSVGSKSLLWLELPDIVPPKTVSRPRVFSGASVTQSGLSMMCCHSMGSAKELSKYWTVVLASHASEMMLKILQARLQHSIWIEKFQVYTLGLEKAEKAEIEWQTFAAS